MTAPQTYTAALAAGDCAGPVEEAVLKQAEMALGLPFPNAYRHFVRAYGAMRLFGGEIAGVTPPPPSGEPPYWTDVVKWNLRRRRDRDCEDFARGLLAISHNGQDHLFLLDTDPAAGGRIVCLGPGSDYLVEYPDFESFVVALHNREVR